MQWPCLLLPLFAKKIHTRRGGENDGLNSDFGHDAGSLDSDSMDGKINPRQGKD